MTQCLNCRYANYRSESLTYYTRHASTIKYNKLEMQHKYDTIRLYNFNSELTNLDDVYNIPNTI
jgi:hypothetical protein